MTCSIRPAVAALRASADVRGPAAPTVPLLSRALYGEPRPPGDGRAYLLWRCRQERAMRGWIKPGCWAWWRLTDRLQAAQRALLGLRDLRTLTTDRS